MDNRLVAIGLALLIAVGLFALYAGRNLPQTPPVATDTAPAPPPTPTTPAP